MNLADHKSTKTERLSALNKLWHICGEVMRLLLKYCIYCVSAPILHRESTDSLISLKIAIEQTSVGLAHARPNYLLCLDNCALRADSNIFTLLTTFQHKQSGRRWRGGSLVPRPHLAHTRRKPNDTGLSAEKSPSMTNCTCT